MSALSAWGTTAATELRLHRRHGVWTLVAVSAVAYSAVVVAVPAGWRGDVVAWLLLLEVTGLGVLAAPALAVLERAHGLPAALRLAGLAPAVAVTVRAALLGGYALAVAAVVLAAAGSGWPVAVLGGATAASVLLSLVAIAVVGAAETLTTYFARLPVVAVVLLGPALVEASGLASHPALAISPLVGAFHLLSGDGSALAVAWLLVWVAGAWAVAVRRSLDVRPGVRAAVGGRRGRSRITAGHAGGAGSAVRSLARVDRHTVLSDQLLVLLLAGLPAIALAARWFAGAGVDLVAARFDVDISPHLPAVWAFVLAVHVPVIVGSLVGLLWSEDRDAGVLPALALTPAGLGTLVAYRLGAAMAVGAVAVAGCLLLAGVAPAAGGVGLAATALAGGIVAAVPAALVGAFARDRVQAVVVLKAMTVPLYAPVGWWFVDSPVAWLLGLVPTAWAAQALWADTAAVAAFAVAAAAATTAVTLAMLVPRMLRGPEGT